MPDVTTRAAKMARKTEHLRDFQRGATWPLHACVIVTSDCQLRCAFCAVGDMERGHHMEFGLFERAMRMFQSHGMRAVELTGGDPFAWPHIDDAMRLCWDVGIQVGIQTNGIDMGKHADSLKFARWVRVSVYDVPQMAALKLNAIPWIPRLSLSTVYVDGMTEEFLSAYRQYALNVGARSARVVLDHFDGRQALKDGAREVVARLGEPLVLVERDEGVPVVCAEAWWKIVLDCDGWLYPCAEVGGHRLMKPPERLRTCHLDDAGTFYSVAPYDLGHRCPTCAYRAHNAWLAPSLEPVVDEDFL